MTKRTKLVAITHISNILGDIEPAGAISDFVHQRGAMICVDGVAYAPHRLVDVQAWDVDFYVFSFYKLYGPHHALLYGKRDILLDLPGINHFFIPEDDIPYKFQPGNVNYELSYGMLGLCDYLSQLSKLHGGPAENLQAQAAFAFDLIAEYEELLSGHLLDYLNGKSNVRVIGRTTANKQFRVPTISFVVEGMDSEQIVLAVDPHQIGIRFGHFYAKRLIDDLGLAPQNGVVRVSMVHYNTLEEVDRLIQVFDQILSRSDPRGSFA
jgi:selenocysteine lyase/cysteine desulfurase